jgi:hypothetical protein
MSHEPAFCNCGRPAKDFGVCWGAKSLYHHTPETDTQIRDAYKKLRKFGNRRAVPALQVKLGWPKHVISKRAREFGLARTKEKPWSSGRKGFAREVRSPCLTRYLAETSSSRFERTETGIKLKMRRMLISKDTLDSALAEAAPRWGTHSADKTGPGEGSIGNGCFRITIGGSDDPNINVDRLPAPDSLKFPFL